MKWNYLTRNDKYRKWHKWFAWYPTKISEDEKVWFESILRRQTSRGNFNWLERFLGVPYYEYKESIFDLIKDGNNDSCCNDSEPGAWTG